MSEDRLQFECYMWFHNEFPNQRGLLFSVPNGGYRNKKEAMKMKSTGVVPGIPDIIYLHRTAIGIEMKNETGILSLDQKKIHAIWNERGFKVYICRSLDQFKQIIAEIHSA